MEALGSMSSVIAVIQVAGAVAKLCGGYILDVKDARRDIERLEQKTVTLRDVMDRLAEIRDQKTTNPVLLPAHVMESNYQCLQDLQKLHDTLQPKAKHKMISKAGWQAIKWPLSKTDVNIEVQRIEGYVTIFNTALQLYHIGVSQVLDSKLDKKWDEQLLKTISRVGDAAFNSYENQRHRRCLLDTRVGLLQEIMDWTTCNSSQHIFWLKGRAGTGKSTVALTIAQSIERQTALLASFFFKRGGGDLARSRKVISTIAFQLAFKSDLFGSFVYDALREDPNLSDSASLSEQYHKLLLHPLQKVQKSAAGSLLFLVVLDALDECDDFDDVRLLLRLLGNTQNLSGLGLRLLVTSRPEVPVRLGFHNLEHIAYYELALHDVPRAIVDRDIKVFITHELTRIKTDRGLPNSWPGDNAIQMITTRAEGLFIYAATVCRYINGPRQVSASHLLKQVCYTTRVKHKSTDSLDEMYSMILKNSMSHDFSTDEEEEVTARLRHIVGSVVLLLDNLSAMELERLLIPSASKGGATVQDTLESLHAILDIPEDLQKPIQMQHLSFRDFLVDRNRCGDVRFFVNQQQGHYGLSIRCLGLMAQSLMQNICHLPNPGTLVSAVSETTLCQHLPPGLIYACRHWIHHAEHGQVSLDDDGPVYAFLQQYCPFWLEVMSLIRKLPEAITIIRRLEGLISAKKTPKLSSLVSDIIRFMYSFSHILSQASLQLYSSGLSFSPSNSTFRQNLCSHTDIDLRVVTQLRSQWNECIQTLEGHSDWVSSVVFSPDGTRLASGSRDKTVRVWDVQTSECQHTLEGHPDWVSSVVFSPDGTRLASGSDDKTVRVWDIQTGRCQHTLEGHSDWVRSVVFSPDGTRLASGSWDRMARVWDVASATELLCCDTQAYGHKIEFNDGGTEISVNGRVINIPLTPFRGPTAGSSGSNPSSSTIKLGIHGDWITWSSERMLWLPPEYRPGEWASHGNTLVIGSDVGRVTFISCDPTSSSFQ